MSLTTIPSISITLVAFIFIGLAQQTSGGADTSAILASIGESFNISGWLFIVPIVVIALIIRKTKPLIALLIGTLLGAVFAIIFQPEVVKGITGAASLSFQSAYKGVMTAMTVDTAIETSNADLNDLFSSGGMAGMLGTIWLILCAMVFGGIMEAIGALGQF